MFCLFGLVTQVRSQEVRNQTRADSLYAVGNYNAAIRAYSKLEDRRAQLQTARAYNAIGLERKAREQYEQLVEQYPAWALSRFELARMHYKDKNYLIAASHLDTLLQQYPGQSEFLFYRGLMDFSRANPEGAIKNWREAIAQDTSHLRAIMSLSTQYIRQNEPDSALRFTEMGMRTNPNHPVLINLKGQALYNRDSFREAIPEFWRLIAMGEEKDHIWEKLGESYIVLSRLDSARLAFRNLETFEGSEALAYYGMGRTFELEFQRDSARIYFKKAIAAKEPALAAEHQALGRLEQGAKNFELALKYYLLVREEIGPSLRVDYQICTLMDKTYADREVVARAYEDYLNTYGKYDNYFTNTARKRLRQLAEESANNPK